MNPHLLQLYPASFSSVFDPIIILTTVFQRPWPMSPPLCDRLLHQYNRTALIFACLKYKV